MILPGIGGFITTHVAAHYDEEKGLFLPPCRTLAFQPGLITDDGLLVQSYMESDDLSYPDAVAKVNAIVSAIKAELTTNGFYELSTIGRLSQDADGNYHFSADTSHGTEALTSDLYGLTPVSIAALKMKVTPQQTRVDIPIVDRGEEEKPYPFYPKKGISIHLSTSTLNKIAGIVVMFLLVFLFATPFGTLKPVSSYSGFNVSLDEDKPARKAVPTRIVPKQLVKKTFNKQDTVSQTASGNYCIVLASGVSRTNGEAFIRNLAENGVKASLLEKGKMRRVVYSSFQSKEDAQNELRNLRKTNDLFASAWVLEK